MYLFMFLFLPLVLTAYCFYKKDRKIIPVIFLGIIAAVLVCGFKAFFLYSHRIIPYSFGKNVWYLLVRQTLIPVLLVYGIFCLWSKDELSFKFESFLPLVLSFYILYLPYNIISTSDHVISTFQLFVKPAVFAVMLLLISFILRKFEYCIREKKIVLLVLLSIFAIVIQIVPALLEGMFFLDMNYVLILILSIIYCGLIPVLFLLKRIDILK